ncbi:hypothetical protein NC652_025791 [Populus alba x Populus x berolinensis]|nr:hypothetical protein NC652_025791 [Populus alba x Populus x berolinensis]
MRRRRGGEVSRRRLLSAPLFLLGGITNLGRKYRLWRHHKRKYKNLFCLGLFTEGALLIIEDTHLLAANSVKIVCAAMPGLLFQNSDGYVWYHLLGFRFLS